jgi:hypothetical protein
VPSVPLTEAEKLSRLHLCPSLLHFLIVLARYACVWKHHGSLVELEPRPFEDNQAEPRPRVDGFGSPSHVGRPIVTFPTGRQ